MKLNDFFICPQLSDTINKCKSQVIGLPHWLAPEVQLFIIFLYLKDNIIM